MKSVFQVWLVFSQLHFYSMKLMLQGQCLVNPIQARVLFITVILYHVTKPRGNRVNLDIVDTSQDLKLHSCTQVSLLIVALHCSFNNKKPNVTSDNALFSTINFLSLNFVNLSKLPFWIQKFCHSNYNVTTPARTNSISGLKFRDFKLIFLALK